jgi:hypothetical protein
MKVLLSIAVMVSLLACARQPAAGADAAAGAGGRADSWGAVLARFHSAGGVDYAALAGDRSDLDSYLGDLGRARPTAMTEEEGLAFWVNAYNAVVLEMVLRSYPDLGSVQDVSGFFDKLTFPVAGEELTLDEIEDRALAFGDPRVHFAVVCASTGCPDLREEPYVAARLDAQLEDQTRRFLAQSEKGLRFEADENRLWLSSIFKWYAGDFTGGSTVVAFFARSKVVEWLGPFLAPELAAEIRESEPSVRYLDYDWSLNDRPGSARAADGQP